MPALPREIPRLSGLSKGDLRGELLRRLADAPVPSASSEILERALSYPYEGPSGSYVLVGTSELPLRSLDAADLAAATVTRDGRDQTLADACAALAVATESLGRPRHTVLAYGSNCSARALLRKFARDDQEASRLVLPVLCGELADFDVVYSSHLSAYGALPATLHHAPGARTRASLTLLTDDQLVRMAETEFRYSLQRLEGLVFEHEHLPAGAVIAFISRHGALGIGGGPVSLAAVRSSGPPGRAVRSEAEALEAVRRWLEVDEALEDFIVANVRDPRRSQGFTERLERVGIEFDYPHAAVLDV